MARFFAQLRLQRCSACLRVWRDGCAALGLLEVEADLRLELDILLRRWSVAKKIRCLSAWEGATIASMGGGGGAAATAQVRPGVRRALTWASPHASASLFSDDAD